MNDPKVAIVCLTYNHSKYILRTITSFKEQTYANVEFFIFDDASTDATFSLAIEAAKDDKRIIVLRNEKNIGAALNSKKAIDMVRGGYEYIGFCEGDDYLINENRILDQVIFMEENRNISLLFTAANIIKESGEYMRLESWGEGGRKFDAKKVIRIGGNLCATASTLYRADVVRNLPDNFYNYPVGDYPLQILASFLGEVVYMPIVGAAYRQQSISSWSRQMISPEKYIENHKKTIEMLDELDIMSSHQNSIAFSFARIKYWYFLAVNKSIGVREKVDIVRSSKGSPKLIMAVIFLAPVFDALNAARRFFINKFIRGKI